MEMTKKYITISNIFILFNSCLVIYLRLSAISNIRFGLFYLYNFIMIACGLGLFVSSILIFFHKDIGRVIALFSLAIIFPYVAYKLFQSIKFDLVIILDKSLKGTESSIQSIISSLILLGLYIFVFIILAFNKKTVLFFHKK